MAGWLVLAGPGLQEVVRLSCRSLSLMHVMLAQRQQQQQAIIALAADDDHEEEPRPSLWASSRHHEDSGGRSDGSFMLLHEAAPPPARSKRDVCVSVYGTAGLARSAHDGVAMHVCLWWWVGGCWCCSWQAARTGAHPVRDPTTAGPVAA